MLLGAAKAQESASDPQGTTEATPKVTINIDKDGIVPLSGLHKWATPTKCHISLTSPQDDDTTVVLVSKVWASEVVNTRLSFQPMGSGESVNPDGTLVIVLPKDGTSKDFSIRGIYRSDHLSDALIEAHHNSVSGDAIGAAFATVYWLTLKHMFVSKGPGTYGVQHGDGTDTLVSYPGPAVYMNAQAALQPAGVSVPFLMIGCVQNALAPNTETETWSNPTWIDPIPNDSVTVYSQYQVVSELATDAYDGANLYNITGGIQDSSPFVSLDNGGGIVPDTDNPNITSDLTKEIDVTTNKGVPTKVKYTLLSS